MPLDEDNYYFLLKAAFSCEFFLLYFPSLLHTVQIVGKYQLYKHS